MDEIYGNTIIVYNKGKTRILKLLDSDYKEEAIILTVTICEVLLKDFCKTCKGVWIHHQYGNLIPGLGSERTYQAKIKIRDYLVSIGAYENFLKSYYVFQGGPSIDPDADALFEVLFGKNDRYINFQNLKEANNIYKFLFNINLLENLDSNQNLSHRKWEQLQKLIQERHDIIHKGSETTMEIDEIRQVISSLDYLKDFLIKQIGSYYPFQQF